MKSEHIYIAEGIVLKRRNTGEADRILTVFTKKYGKIRVIAKGIRKITSRRSGHLEIFNNVMLTLHQHGQLDIVTEAQSWRSRRFDSDVGCIGYAYCMSELVDQLLPERQEHEDIFILLRDGLASLQQTNDVSSWQAVMTHFIHELLWKLGFLASSRRLPTDEIQPYIEQITERHLRTWPLLTVLTRSS